MSKAVPVGSGAVPEGVDDPAVGGHSRGWYNRPPADRSRASAPEPVTRSIGGGCDGAARAAEPRPDRCSRFWRRRGQPPASGVPVDLRAAAVRHRHVHPGPYRGHPGLARRRRRRAARPPPARAAPPPRRPPPPGVPDMPFMDPEPLKHRFGLAGRDVILGFGLLSPNKRYELVIEALPALVHAVPETLFVIVGETPPG